MLEEACPRTPLAKSMASPCAACRFATCKFRNLKKIFLGALAKFWVRPCQNTIKWYKLETKYKHFM